METTSYVPDGLDLRSHWQIMQEIKLLGFNSIRVTISDQMIRENKRIRIKLKNVTHDPGFAGLHPLDVLDRLIYAAKDTHLLVILDNHGSRASSTKTSNIEPTWNFYGEQSWTDDWRTLATRYLRNPTVTGFDLRNEPHTDWSGRTWSLNTYLEQGATWGPYPNRRHPDKRWKPASDWAEAATECGNAVLAVNPHLLIFVEGVQLYPDRTQAGGVFTYWWGSILTGLKVDPIVFKVPNQLVYAPHEWGPRRAKFYWFTWNTNYQMIVKVMNENWAFVLHTRNPVLRHPVWLGEFNTCNYALSCVQPLKSQRWHGRGSQGQWFQIFLQFMRANPEVSWGYYPINGTNGVGQRSNNSILDRTWTRVRMPLLMSDLRTIMGRR
jgi:aryl-phospho-beta-D-glucosidase BglC (GH1 family)